MDGWQDGNGHRMEGHDICIMDQLHRASIRFDIYPLANEQEEKVSRLRPRNKQGCRYAGVKTLYMHSIDRNDHNDIMYFELDCDK